MRLRFSIGLIFALAIWLVIGIDRQVGDHEVGTSWTPFIKHRLRWQSLYSNPAQRGLDVEPFANLSQSEQQQFIEYCSVRFGLIEPIACEQQIASLVD